MESKTVTQPVNQNKMPAATETTPSDAKEAKGDPEDKKDQKTSPVSETKGPDASKVAEKPSELAIFVSCKYTAFRMNPCAFSRNPVRDSR